MRGSVAYAKSHLIEKYKEQVEEITVPFLRNGNLVADVLN